MRRWFFFALALAAALGGCSFGFGSSYVGQWRERNQVDYEVCIEDQAGRCTAQKTITTHRPARRYWGFQMLFPALGVAQGSFGDKDDTGVRFELGAEYLRGRGDLAFGVRAGEILEAAGAYWFDSPMVTAMGHLGLSDRFSAYGGLGGSPYARLSLDLPGTDEQKVDSAYLAGRALAGLEMVIAGNEETRFTLALEGDTVMSRFDGTAFRSSSLTFQFGLSL
jgi:hypothetical protein